MKGSAEQPPPAAGTYTITITRKPGSPGGVCDFWVSTWLLSTNTSPSFLTPDDTRKITSPGTGDAVITTGAYVTKTSWVNGNGQVGSYPGVTLDEIADFSSPGPRRDGVVRPDVIAPGYGVVAANAIDSGTSNLSKVLDRVHRINKGTSQATAHTTGALALLLEVDDNLTPSEARQQLTDMAITDSHTGITPNGNSGYGKLRLLQGLVGVPEDPGVVRLGFLPPYPNPSESGTLFRFSLKPEDVPDSKQDFGIQIVDLAGRSVATLPLRRESGPQEIMWQGVNDIGHAVPAGVYFARLQAGKHTAVHKILRLSR
jgi:hypothetical protein